MQKKLTMVFSLLLLGTTGLLADFSYEETSKMTGGALASAMKVVSVFSRQAGQPIRSSVMVKGDRMARVTADTVEVVDLAAETITSINVKQKTYSVITFAQMAKIMEQMSQKAAASTGATGPTAATGEIKFKASVKETGQTRQISGLSTREVILTMATEGADKESGQKGSMNIVSNQWLARDVPGYGELKAFYQRLSQKMTWMPGSSNAFLQGRSDLAEGMADLQREAAKLDGVAVLQVISMGGAAEGQPAQQPAAEKKEEQPAPSITGALGRLGGLGGLGRRKKEEAPKEEKPQTQASSTASASLLEMTSEMSAFSTALIDPSKFQVPAGFKQVESPLAKAVK